VSPRSEEFWAAARDRLAAARTARESGFAAAAVSLAYYGMLYAARAALSEEDRNAKTHSGLWTTFVHTFVTSGRFDAELAAQARSAQRSREAVDYDAREVSPEEADDALRAAERFVGAVEALLGDGD
jgi:uncharacterized protein (UPF0332 family)